MTQTVQGGFVRGRSSTPDGQGPLATIGGIQVPLGYEQITGVTGAAVKALSGMAGASWALVTAKVDGRWRDDGTPPTAAVGHPITAGLPWRFDQVDLTAVRFITVDTLDVSYYA